MEATTETNPNNRELTAGEIKIAFAQIEDRLHRVAKAQDKQLKLFDKITQQGPYSVDLDTPELTEEEEIESDKKTDAIFKQMERRVRIEYDILESVHLFGDSEEGCLNLSNYRIVLPRIKDWINGKMTKEGFSDMYFFFEEDAQCDWGWILMETPFYYYETPAPDDFDHEAQLEELSSIGTRSRSKNNRENISWYADLYGISDEPQRPQKTRKSPINKGPVKPRTRKTEQ